MRNVCLEVRIREVVPRLAPMVLADGGADLHLPYVLLSVACNGAHCQGILTLDTPCKEGWASAVCDPRKRLRHRFAFPPGGTRCDLDKPD